MMRRALRWMTLIGVPVMLIAGLCFIYLFDPLKHGHMFVPCSIHASFGLYCPACGNTRALHALLHGNMLRALQNNVLILPLLLALSWVLVGEYLRLACERRVLWLPKKIPMWVIIVFLIVVIAFTVLRNIPYPPFDWLAPVGALVF